MRKTLAIAAASMVAMAGAAYANAPGADGPKQITRAEVQAQVKSHFDKLDANKDGVVTRAEFDAARAKMQAERKAKAAERHAERFAKLDTDKNGQISRAEYDAAYQARADRKPGERKAGEHRAGDHKAGERGHGDKRWAHRGGKGMGHGAAWFDRLDDDKDGRVTLAEASKKPLEMFDKADANRDGVVTPEEHKAAREKMREEFKAKREG